MCGLAGIGVGPGDEVIMPAYNWIASAAAVLALGVVPIMAEVVETLLLDAEDAEGKITPYTTAIMPVHCYGHPCDVVAIQEIADTYNLKVIYDAAHAFAVQDAGGSILRHGDLSVMSFHATKVFNTFEGGCHRLPR